MCNWVNVLGDGLCHHKIGICPGIQPNVTPFLNKFVPVYQLIILNCGRDGAANIVRLLAVLYV